MAHWKSISLLSGRGRVQAQTNSLYVNLGTRYTRDNLETQYFLTKTPASGRSHPGGGGGVRVHAAAADCADGGHAAPARYRKCAKTNEKICKK
jgi:hypothetical protein